MEEIYIETPLLYSQQLSKLICTKVFLKLENVQPCNSFKIRGISRLCKKKIEEGCTGVVTFSGGNAGMALAYTSSLLNLTCHVVVPSFVSPRILEKMRSFGAIVTIALSSKEAYDKAEAMSQADPKLAFVHPYDNEELWAGYSTIVDEIKKQLFGTKPSCIVVSVGGGGLLTGLLKGLESVGWQDIPIVAMETIGAHCFNKSIHAGKIVENLLTSVAKTLGAPTVTPTLLELCPKFNVISEILSDKEAVSACLKFADDHAFLVEPACGVSLATIYSNLLIDILQTKAIQLDSNSGPVVVIVCGGSDASPQILLDYAKTVGLQL